MTYCHLQVGYPLKLYRNFNLAITQKPVQILTNASGKQCDTARTYN